MRGAESRLRQNGIALSWSGQPPEGFASLRVDSRTVRPGDLFCAISGTALDGHDYVAAAAAAGAVAAIVERSIPATIPTLVVSDSRAAAAHIASLAAGDPVVGLRVVGVTGTNGKTTTTLLARHLLTSLGPTAALGTLGLYLPDGTHRARSRITTPGPVELVADIGEVVASGAAYFAMEVSSHALDQRRVESVPFAVAVFTNLTREHLDYHADMESYRRAKLRFVDLLAPDGVAVVNAEDRAWDSLRAAAPRVLTFGRNDGPDVRAEDISYSSYGSRWTLVTPAGRAAVEFPLLGDFNISNALGAAAAAHVLGIDAATTAVRLATAPQVPGRMEVLAREPGPIVLRDYAHTPDGLKRALDSLRSLADGRLTVVFGCGGDRDRGKRPLMGQAAVGSADRVILTTDNPRMEDPDRIVRDIAGDLPAGSFEVIEDRSEAIESAVCNAGNSDVVLLAGKGHETYQDILGEKQPFDEAAIVRGLIGHGS
ncbi:MAG: UDP-N-acetylmuramoyl-L-alanyl-D-glutamate--2,6-diaminopimelate ligase [Gemmatimonadota bacterium]|nr:UDP-N-acetylmuramoyl-L-alanyl-D-glutamate--2,6-diaminopimelate ligase [Gemmatimonadota bacterium]